MGARILFSTVCRNRPPILGFSPLDQMAYRLTRGQGIFTLYEHTHAYALHLLAQNLPFEAVVLENPSLAEFAGELRQGYSHLCLNFDMRDAEVMAEMVAEARRVSPKTKIILGGYGVICLPELARRQALPEVDAVCHGEGIGFLRRHFALDPDAPVRCRLPKGGSTLPWLNPRAPGTNGVVLSGLGCTKQCPFCTTSAYTRGRYVEVMDPEQIVGAIQGYFAASPFTGSITIYDENLLDHPDKARALGRLIAADPRLGLRRVGFFTFASLQALARYEPEELLLLGVDTVWVGVESRFSPLGKRRPGDTPEQVAAAFTGLRALGIKTVGSWIIGQDFQDPTRLSLDEDFFVGLGPTMQQLSLLTVAPGTPLWRDMARQDRVPEAVPFAEYQLYGDTYRPKHLSHGQMLERLEVMYRRINERWGPTVTRVLETDLLGLLRCRRSRHALLREQRAAYFAERCQSYYPLLRTARALAPGAGAAARLGELERRYHEVLGPPSAAVQAVSESILRRAEQAAALPEDELWAGRREPFRRYDYPEAATRQPLRPYRVSYPGAGGAKSSKMAS